MCVANSARSQMAEGIAKSIYLDFKIESAGSKPTKLNPIAVKVMNEIGIDISNNFSKDINSLNKKFIDELDYVITLCKEEVCPIIITNAKKIHLPFLDPAIDNLPEKELIKNFRDIRNQIKKKIIELKTIFEVSF